VLTETFERSPAQSSRTAYILGDPTLRHYATAAPTTLSSAVNGTNVIVSWSAYSTPGATYLVSRAVDPLAGNWTSLTPAPTTHLSITNTQAAGSTWYYVVKAVSLTTMDSGSYFNVSQGVITNVFVP
jgi:hypothetical protein